MKTERIRWQYRSKKPGLCRNLSKNTVAPDALACGPYCPEEPGEVDPILGDRSKGQGQGAGGLRAVKVGLGTPRRKCREVATVWRSAVDSVGVVGTQTFGQGCPVDHSTPAPATVLDARRKYECGFFSYDRAHARQLQDEVVAVGPEFDLEVASVGAKQKQLNDLVVPQTRGWAGVLWRCRIVVKWGVDVDDKAIVMPL